MLVFCDDCRPEDVDAYHEKLITGPWPPPVLTGDWECAPQGIATCMKGPLAAAHITDRELGSRARIRTPGRASNHLAAITGNMQPDFRIKAG